MLTVLQGDAVAVLRTLPDASVQMCVTSPPYWGLRDYQCEGQLGLEKSPAEYIAKMVEVFREVRRVLRLDGVVFLNLGDSYAGGGKGGNPPGSTASAFGSHAKTQEECAKSPAMDVPAGLKPKDLIGIPWRVAFALQADGWWLRSDIIWSKPNPMPESVTDRPTKAHEYLFLLAKSERYFYDADAIKEDAGGWNGSEFHDGKKLDRSSECRQDARSSAPSVAVITLCAVHVQGRRTADGGVAERGSRNKHAPSGLSPRSLILTRIFATYPPDLIKPCILAGSRPGDVVLDPFGGSGTTGMVALELGRKAVLIELNPAYIELIEARCNVTPGLPLT